MFILKLLSVIFYYVIADINPNRSIWVKFPSDLILQPVLICLVVGGIVDSRSVLCSLYRNFSKFRLCYMGYIVFTRIITHPGLVDVYSFEVVRYKNVALEALCRLAGIFGPACGQRLVFGVV